MPIKPAFTVVIMGVSGSGKTTVGKLVAARTGSEFSDADDFHSPENKAKMAAGEPLSEADRRPWLDALRRHIVKVNGAGNHLVLACSALKRQHRGLLRLAGPQVAFVHLSVPREVLVERLAARKGHFFPAALLDSQLATLEVPERALILDATAAPDELARQIAVAVFRLWQE